MAILSEMKAKEEQQDNGVDDLKKEKDIALHKIELNVLEILLELEHLLLHLWWNLINITKVTGCFTILQRFLTSLLMLPGSVPLKPCKIMKQRATQRQLRKTRTPMFTKLLVFLENKFEVEVYSSDLLRISWNRNIQKNKLDIRFCLQKESTVNCTSETVDADEGVFDWKRSSLKSYSNYTVSLHNQGRCLYEKPFLNPSSRPSEPINVNLTTITANTTVIRWSEPTQKNGPIDGYNVILKSEGRQFHFHTMKRRIEIVKLLENNTVIEVFAYNKFFDSELLGEKSSYIHTVKQSDQIEYSSTHIPRTDNGEGDGLSQIEMVTPAATKGHSLEYNSSNEMHGHRYALFLCIFVLRLYF